jgi:DNA polymerase, archaea type
VIESFLYGYDPHPNIIAVQPVEDDKMRVYVRKDDQITFEDFPFYPFFFISDDAYLKTFQRKYWIKELNGDHYYKYLVVFTSWFDLWDCIRLILMKYNQQPVRKAISYADLPIIYLRPDPVCQFLQQTGKTLFKNLEIINLHRAQICLEAYKKPGTKTSYSERINDRILLIALTDNLGNKHFIGKKDQTEKQLLEIFIDLIKSLDPDIIEGTELHTFILPYLIKRCELNDLELGIGRDNSKPKTFELTSARAENPTEPASYSIAGRHLIDSSYLFQIYDYTKRVTSELDLQAIAELLGYKEQLTKPEESGITDGFDMLMESCSGRLERMSFISDLFLPVFFNQAKIFPYNLETLLRLNSVSKIESVMVRCYLKEKYSLPIPEPAQQGPGAHTQVFLRGVLGPAISIEVDCLYPTIMIKENINPKSDNFGIFNLILRELTAIRNEFKTDEYNDKSKQSDILHNSFKLLINSFYSYLSYSRGLFNDYIQATSIAEKGHVILRQIMDAIHSKGGQIVEADTDSIIFIPPPFINTMEKQDEFVQEINNDIPKDFNLMIEGRFKKMMSYKKKNYATLDYKNKIRIRGSALISKNIERFGRNFIQECTDCILNNNYEIMRQLYLNLYSDIINHHLQIQDFMRVETMKDSLEQYSKEVESGDRNKSAGYELAIKSGKAWKIGQKIFYYVTGPESNVRAYENSKFAEEWDPNFPDENTGYYLKRLDEFTKKFEDFFSEKDFKLLFSNESDQLFQNEDISTVITEVGEEPTTNDGTNKDSTFGDYSIQLAED